MIKSIWFDSARYYGKRRSNVGCPSEDRIITVEQCAREPNLRSFRAQSAKGSNHFVYTEASEHRCPCFRLRSRAEGESCAFPLATEMILRLRGRSAAGSRRKLDESGGVAADHSDGFGETVKSKSRPRFETRKARVVANLIR